MYKQAVCRKLQMRFQDSNDDVTIEGSGTEL